MKLIIIEGPDNTGKSYLANTLIDYYKSQNKTVDYLHFTAPESNNTKEAAKLEHQHSLSVAKNIYDKAADNSIDYMILDRSWYSEFVYGHMYRHRTQSDCLSNIRKVEDIIINALEPDDVCYVYLTASPAFLSKHEDDKSLSKGELDTIKKEIKLFDTLSQNIMCGNIKIINVEDKNNQYKDIKEMINEIEIVLNHEQ